MFDLSISGTVDSNLGAPDHGHFIFSTFSKMNNRAKVEDIYVAYH